MRTPLTLLFAGCLLVGCVSGIPRRGQTEALGTRGSPAAAVFPPLGSWGDYGSEASRRDGSLNPRSEGSLMVADAWDARPELTRSRRVSISRSPWTFVVFIPERRRYRWR